MRAIFKKGNRRSGFTLIELMVVMLISTVVVVAIYSAYKSQQDSYYAQEQVAEMQQNLRAAIQLLNTDIRMAGFDPTESAGSAILTANAGTLRFTRDIIGGESDGQDNDNDGFTDGADDDEDLYGDGSITAGSIEDVTYQLVFNTDGSTDGSVEVADTDSDGQVNDEADQDGDGDTNDNIAHFGRNIGAGLQAIAENIEKLEFFYTMDDDTQVSDPVASGFALADIRAVEVAILARASQGDLNYTHTASYTIPSGATWTPPNDNFRRRFITMTIQARNMGL